MPVTQEMSLAPSAAYDHVSNQPPASNSHPHTNVSAEFVAPMQWQSDLRSSLYSEVSSGIDEYLPAFPGQRFPVGSEHSLGSSEVDSQARGALLGYHLDPHPKLNAGDIS